VLSFCCLLFSFCCSIRPEAIIRRPYFLLEVLRLIAAGRSNEEVAAELFIAVSTVKTHLINIYGKLEVKRRTQAIAKARQLKLL